MADFGVVITPLERCYCADTCCYSVGILRDCVVPVADFGVVITPLERCYCADTCCYSVGILRDCVVPVADFEVVVLQCNVVETGYHAVYILL